MAFALSSNFSVKRSTFIDNSRNISSSVGPSELSLHILLNASSIGAAFDAQARYPPPVCHPGTRTSLLGQIFDWVESGEERMLFLDGPAGVGKSAIAQTVCRVCASRGLLGASYFFCRGSPDRNTIASLIPTIAYHVATSIPGRRSKIQKVLRKNPSILDKSPEAQLQKLLIEPLQLSVREHLLHGISANSSRYLLVVDALDECRGEDDQRRIIALLTRLVEADPNHTIQCLITSRPEPHILVAIDSLKTKVARITVNHKSRAANMDIRAYLHSGFDKISSRLPQSIPRPWPPENVVETMVQKAGGIFSYASTILQYIANSDSLPTTRLKHVLDLPRDAKPFEQLDRLYQQILSSCPITCRSILLHILGFTLLRSPHREKSLDLAVIEDILDLKPGQATVILRNVHSILEINTTSPNWTVSVLHRSFGDFIFDGTRAGNFFIDHRHEHFFLAMKCIKYLGHRETCKLDRINKETLLYAWQSWAYHVIKAGELYYPRVATALKNYKAPWYTPLSKVYHGHYIDGLDLAIQLLQYGNEDNPARGLIPDLRRLRQKLERNFFWEVMTDTTTRPIVIPVFADPGIDFFAYLQGEYTYLVIQCGREAGARPDALYFHCCKKTYNLTELDVQLSQELIQGAWDKSMPFQDHAPVAARCIRILADQYSNDTEYAATYWAQHVCHSYCRRGMRSYIALLKLISQISFRPSISERQVELADVNIVRAWLRLQLQKGWYHDEEHLEQIIANWDRHHAIVASYLNVGIFVETSRGVI